MENPNVRTLHPHSALGIPWRGERGVEYVTNPGAGWAAPGLDFVPLWCKDSMGFYI